MPGAAPLNRPEAGALLAWYDRHRRRLPWRALPGEKADPYRVWLSEIMLQQTTTVAAAPYFLRFLTRFPDVAALAGAPVEEVLKLWAGLGYYARARNLHACAKAVMDRHHGIFPSSEAELLTLPGIGPYTAAAVAAIAFDLKATPMDGNWERVVARLFAVEEPLPGSKPRLRTLSGTLTPDERPGDFAQAVMDLGATICTPKRPACVLCPWATACEARAKGIQDSLPRKAAKPAKPERFGAAFWARRPDGAILLRRRPPKGLLGGMTELPTTPWGPRLDRDTVLTQAPFPADWRIRTGVVTHVFSHFALTLEVFAADLPQTAVAPEGAWWAAPASIDSEALPSVFRKAVELARR
ncbi:A/G-specific adenine glycosylase [Agaricicola taiwanensis]|uniref:Adenine DNA glycosylase n=1 Tax=Agaricicola taiwanensis TaxID=591372 RepID=A0A8J2VNT7_9RHOB|nr:A/G-specific adenine glycosylase [Agaricicola taiwanensis]GGE34783.1 A/G-specific adenine glycosylase [Agaricicola taiwanensis]